MFLPLSPRRRSIGKYSQFPSDFEPLLLFLGFLQHHIASVNIPRAHVHWRCLLAKLSAIATHISHYCTCLGHLGRCNTQRIVSIFCRATQGGQGKYKCVTDRPIYRSVVWLSCVVVAGVITPTFANVNIALLGKVAHHWG